MDWNVQKYHETCGRVTEHGEKLVERLKAISCGEILDLGCGTGVLTNEISRFAKKVVGIDSSPQMIEKAMSSYPSIEFHLMDARSIIWENRFDAVFSNAVFHFIREQDALLDSIIKSLKPKGTLISEFGAHGNISELLKAIEHALVSRGRPYMLRFYYPTTDEYSKLLVNHGFKIEFIIAYELDTTLKEGEAGLRNWINQIFDVELKAYELSERQTILSEIEAALMPSQWDGANWHLHNRRIQFYAYKQLE